jgi:hypothetical protein
MIPAYFPFSTLSETTAEALFGFFETIILHRPQTTPLPDGLALWLAAGRIDQRVPGEEAPERLAQALSACRQWAIERDLGTGEAGAFLKAQPVGTPLHDEEAVGRLRSQILGQRGPETANSDHLADPYFDARLFMAMPEAYDMDNEKAAAMLMRLQTVETDVLRGLHGEEDSTARIGLPAAAIAAAEDRGAFMTARRLRAWTILVSQEPVLAPVLITDSLAMGAELLERCYGAPQVELGLPNDGEGDPAEFRRRLLTWLERLVQADAPEAHIEGSKNQLPFRWGESLGQIGGQPFMRFHLLIDCPTGRLLEGVLPEGVLPRWTAGAAGERHGVIAVLHT